MTLKEEMQADHDEVVMEAGGVLKWLVGDSQAAFPCALSAVERSLDIELGGKQQRFNYLASVRIDLMIDGDGNPAIAEEGTKVTLIDPQFEADEKLGRVIGRSRDSLGAVMVFQIETREM